MAKKKKAAKRPVARATASTGGTRRAPTRTALAAAGGGNDGLVAAGYFVQVAQNWLSGGIPLTDTFALNVVTAGDPVPYVKNANPIASGQPVVTQFWDTVKAMNWQTGWHFEADPGRNITAIRQ